jgi:hypothetical protein
MKSFFIAPPVGDGFAQADAGLPDTLWQTAGLKPGDVVTPYAFGWALPPAHVRESAFRSVEGVAQSSEQKVGLSRVRPDPAPCVLRVVERSQLAAGDGFRQRE